MNLRTIPKTGWKISEVAFGGAALSGEGGGYGFGEISEDQSIHLVQAAYAAGINIFDAAPIYGFGEAERRIGKAVKKFRDNIYLVSKSGVTWDTHKRVDLNNDPKITQSMLNQSLKDLDTDWIDLYFIHWPDPRTDIRKPMEVLARAKETGKIRSIGLSNPQVEDIAKAQEIAEIDVLQAEHQFFHPAKELLQICQDQKFGFMGWGTFAKGILTGRVDHKRSFDRYDARSRAPWWNKKENEPKIEYVKKLKQAIEMPLDHFALHYSLSFPEVTCALCGFRSEAQLNSALPFRKHVFSMENVPDFDPQ